MDVVHGLVSFSDWREQGERGKELIMGLRTTGAKLEKTKNKEKSADQCDQYNLRTTSDWVWLCRGELENLVSSLWLEVLYLTSVYVDVEGWVSAIRNYEQQWACISKSHGRWKEPVCICSLWSSVKCLCVLLCWQVRYDGGLDTWTKHSVWQGSARLRVHLMVGDLDRTDQPRPIPGVNGPDFIS